MSEKCKGCDMAEEALAICETCDEIDALRAEVERLEAALKIGCEAGREELIAWLEHKKYESDQPFEKEKILVLRMFVFCQALKALQKGSEK